MVTIWFAALRVPRALKTAIAPPGLVLPARRCGVLPYEGEVVGAFRILKHFDIAQPYNSATGEKLNILAGTHRCCGTAQYMRVDWLKSGGDG